MRCAMFLLPLLLFTALACALPVALVGGICVITARAVSRVRRHDDLPGDWWEQFERDFEAYAEAVRNEDPER